MAPVILLLRRLERIFPQQPNMSVVKRFSDTLVAASEAFSSPHLPELQLLPPPENPPKHDDEIPLQDLPWGVFNPSTTTYHSNGTPVDSLKYSERVRLQTIHGRYPPGVLFIAATTSKPAEVRSKLHVDGFLLYVENCNSYLLLKALRCRMHDVYTMIWSGTLLFWVNPIRVPVLASHMCH